MTGLFNYFTILKEFFLSIHVSTLFMDHIVSFPHDIQQWINQALIAILFTDEPSPQNVKICVNSKELSPIAICQISYSKGKQS